MRRFKSESAGWHVIARGARRLNLYRDADDYLRFISILKYSLKQSGCTLWAMTLMANHYHLVLFGSSVQLTACMRRVDMMYSSYHNKRYRLTGHAFEGPFHAYRQGSGVLLLRTIAYVFSNPVTAGISREPGDYDWTSYKSFLGLPGSPIETNVSSLMAQVKLEPTKAWARFYEAMRREAARPKQLNSGHLTRIEVHSQQFEWLLDHARGNAGRLYGEDPVLVAMYWARQIGVTPKAMAKVLGAALTDQIRGSLFRFNRRMEADPELQAKLALT